MDFSKLNILPEDVRSISNVSADSLARWCGLIEDSETNSRPDDDRLFILCRQLGVLQQGPTVTQRKIHSEFAAKHLPALMKAYRDNSGVRNTSMMMLNSVSYTPYFIRFLRTTAGKDMAAIQAHQTAISGPIANDPDVVGETVQFLATLLLLQDTSSVSEEDKKEIIKKCTQWKQIFRDSGRVAESASERCIALLKTKIGLPAGYDMVKTRMEECIEKCGVTSCPRRKQASGSDLMQCGRCKSAVYCGTEHQKEAWASHKTTCFAPSF